jgi:hypothetical protein
MLDFFYGGFQLVLVWTLQISTYPETPSNQNHMFPNLHCRLATPFPGQAGPNMQALSRIDATFVGLESNDVSLLLSESFLPSDRNGRQHIREHPAIACEVPKFDSRFFSFGKFLFDLLPRVLVSSVRPLVTAVAPSRML